MHSLLVLFVHHVDKEMLAHFLKPPNPPHTSTAPTQMPGDQ